MKCVLNVGAKLFLLSSKIPCKEGLPSALLLAYVLPLLVERQIFEDNLNDDDDKTKRQKPAYGLEAADAFKATNALH